MPTSRLWLRAAGEARGLLLLSLAWLAAGQAGGELGAVAELPAGRGQARCLHGLPAFIAGGPGLFQVLLWTAGHRDGRRDGVRWDRQEALAAGPSPGL